MGSKDEKPGKRYHNEIGYKWYKSFNLCLKTGVNICKVREKKVV